MNLNRERVGDWMQTYTGRQFWPIDPRAEEIFIEDIAHALAMQCRYAGHSLRFYSVAEHCVLLSRAVQPRHALWALLHDASEAYLTDVIRPLKPYLQGYKFREKKVMEAVAKRFDLQGEMPAEVEQADIRICLDERAQNMAPTGHDWQIKGGPLGIELQFWSPEVAERMFLDAYYAINWAAAEA